MKEYGLCGFEVVGLVYEYMGDFECDVEMVCCYVEWYDVDYVYLFVGMSDKEKVFEMLLDLIEIFVFLMFVFFDCDYWVVCVYLGFVGLGMGEYFDFLCE